MLLHVRHRDGARFEALERRPAGLHGPVELPHAPFRLLRFRPDPRNLRLERLHGFPEPGLLPAETLKFILYLQDLVINLLKSE